jgi:hypothetical protein
MSWSEITKTHARMLKGPLIGTVIVFVAILIGAFVWYTRRANEVPPIVEAPAPGASLRNLVLLREGDEYFLYFSLCDEAGREIARTGEAQLRIIQLGTVRVEGGPSFLSETVLLDAKFEVGLSTYRWLDVGGGLLFMQRRLIIPQRVRHDLLKRVPVKGVPGKVVIVFRDEKVFDAKVHLEKVLRFP